MPYDPANVFARILRGEAPCIKVSETERSLAFMDVMPQAEGHVLVIPKEPAESIHDLSHSALAACMETVKEVAAAVQAALQPDGLLIAQLNGEAAGQTVGHLHVHVIPRWRGVALKPHASAPADSAQLEELAQRIRKALR